MAELKEIPVDMILLPDQLMRTETMQQEIDALIEDIAARGLIQPIGVTSLSDGRYRIRWGARRTLAHRLMNKQTILAFCHQENEADETDDMARENYQRVQVSDGEDVRFITRYMREKGISAAECARRLRIPYARVLRAEAIAGGDEDVVRALYDGKISAAVAVELVQAPSKLHTTNLLYHAIHVQSSAKFYRAWIDQINTSGQAVGIEEVQQIIASESRVNYANMLQCQCCGQYKEYADAHVIGCCKICWSGLMALKEQALEDDVRKAQGPMYDYYGPQK